MIIENLGEFGGREQQFCGKNIKIGIHKPPPKDNDRCVTPILIMNTNYSKLCKNDFFLGNLLFVKNGLSKNHWEGFSKDYFV